MGGARLSQPGWRCSGPGAPPCRTGRAAIRRRHRAAAGRAWWSPCRPHRRSQCVPIASAASASSPLSTPDWQASGWARPGGAAHGRCRPAAAHSGRGAAPAARCGPGSRRGRSACAPSAPTAPRAAARNGLGAARRTAAAAPGPADAGPRRHRPSRRAGDCAADCRRAPERPQPRRPSPPGHSCSRARQRRSTAARPGPGPAKPGVAGPGCHAIARPGVASAGARRHRAARRAAAHRPGASPAGARAMGPAAHCRHSRPAAGRRPGTAPGRQASKEQERKATVGALRDATRARPGVGIGAGCAAGRVRPARPRDATLARCHRFALTDAGPADMAMACRSRFFSTLAIGLSSPCPPAVLSHPLGEALDHTAGATFPCLQPVAASAAARHLLALMKQALRLFACLLQWLGLTALPGAVRAQADEHADISALLQPGQAAQALTLAEQRLTEHPRDPQLRFLRALAQTDAGEPERAIASFTELTQEFPELPEPYNNLAVLYARQNQWDQARATLEMALRANPGYATAQENLGDIYVWLASQAYSKAMQLDANSAASVRPKLALIRELFGTDRAR